MLIHRFRNNGSRPTLVVVEYTTHLSWQGGHMGQLSWAHGRRAPQNSALQTLNYMQE